ncbi:MAG: M48 family metalloprotease [bacterium]|nr:M48 family metalloprotease [bacterium]
MSVLNLKDYSMNMRTVQKCGLVILLLALLASAAVMINGCATNAATGKRQFNLISESQEIAIGRDADKQISAQMGLYPNDALQKYVSDLGLKMAAQGERPNLPWSFKVVDDPAVNAFALPGGFIYVTRGILAHLNSEAELAGVVGHEIGHVTGKHSVTQMSTAQITQLGLGVSTLLEPRLQRYADAPGRAGTAFLKFGRDDETEADALGLRYMRRINKDPRELVGVMEMLDGVTQAAGGSDVPEWLSTHPNPGNRAQNILGQLDTMSIASGSEVNREKYLEVIDGIVFGDNPRHGYFKESLFLHPDFKFRYEFPQGWRTANQVQGVVGISANQDAMIQLTLAEGSSHTEAANGFFSQQGVVATGRQSANVNGIPASWGKFSVATESGELRGVAYFYSYDSKIFQILAYGTEAGWSANEQEATNSTKSFAKLTDAKALAVQP